MPTLKQLTCTLEKEPSRTPLTEYSTSYSDGFVESYVAVPDERTGFGIHLHSHGYIAPGLAMFVYIDGVYQCNRHRHSLLVPDGTITPEFYEVDFHVFQQEEKVGKGKFLGRAWSFNTLATGDKMKNITETILGNIGTIEVVVRRLYPPVQSVLPTRPANGDQVKSTPAKTGKQKEKQKGLKIKPDIFPGSVGFGNDGAGDQKFGAGLDGPSDDRYHDPTYYYYDDKPHRSRHYHHRRASPSPPPRRDFGPSYADYLRWRDTHPDAVVPSRSRDPQRSSSYYAQYRPSGSDDSRDHSHHGYTSNAYRQRRRARATDDDPVPRVAPTRRPSGSTSSSSVTQRPLSSAIDSSAAIPQARPTMQSLNPFALGTNGLPSYRVGQPDGSLSSSTRPLDPMYNPRYSPEEPHAAPLQNHNFKTDGHDGNSKMPGGWLGEDPKDSIKAANPYATGPINEDPSGLFVRGATTSSPAVDNSRWGAVNEHGQSSGGQGGGLGSAAANVSGQGDAWGTGGDNSGGQDNAWGATGGNSGGQDATWGSNGNNSGGQDNGWGTGDGNGGGQDKGWRTSGDNNVGGDNLGGGVDQNTKNDLSADSGGNTGWGPTNGQEQTSQQGWGESGGTQQQDTGTSGAWQDSSWPNGGVNNTNNPSGQNDNSGDAENNTDQDDRWPDNTDNSSAKNNDAAQDPGSNWGLQDNNAAQNTNSNWDTPNDNNPQQATDNNNNNNSNWETQTTTAAAAAPADQSIAAPKAGSWLNGSNKNGSKAPHNSFMHKPLVPEQPFVKGYWNNWAKAPNAPPALPQRQPKQNEDAPTEIFAPSEVPYVVPEKTAREKLVDSYVHHGKGYDYAHVTGRPEYIDSWEEPYAVFRFKYRSRNILSQILGEGGKEEMEKDKAREMGEEQKRRLSLMSKDELIQQLIEKSAKAESQKAGGSQQKAPSVSSQPQPVQQWANNVAAATASGSKAGSSSEDQMTCDRCNGNLVGEWWHCKGCGDDYDICCACVERKLRCNDDSHDLIQWKDNVDLGNGVKGIQATNKTLPGIQKSSDIKDGNAGGGRIGGGSNNNDNWNVTFTGNATSGSADNAAGGEWGAVDANAPAGVISGGGDNAGGGWGAVNLNTPAGGTGGGDNAGADSGDTKPKWW